MIPDCEHHYIPVDLDLSDLYRCTLCDKHTTGLQLVRERDGVPPMKHIFE